MTRQVIYWLVQQLLALLFIIMNFVFRLSWGRLFFRMVVRGKKNISGLRRPVILISNHKTFVDHFYIAAALFLNTGIMPIRLMATDWIYRVRWFKGGFILRWFMGLGGAFQERRGLGLLTALRILEAGRSVAIYPEGMVYRGQGIADIKKGVVWLAQKTGAAVLPLALRGLENSNSREFFFGRRTITVVFGSPFRLGPNEDINSALRIIKSKLEELYYD